MNRRNFLKQALYATALTTGLAATRLIVVKPKSPSYMMFTSNGIPDYIHMQYDGMRANNLMTHKSLKLKQQLT